MTLDRECKALPHYEAVAAAGTSQYSERSLNNAANIAYNLGDYEKAATLYERLTTNAESDASLLQGEVGALRCAVALKRHNDIVTAGDRLLAEKKADAQLKEEASLAMARSYFNQQEYDMAFNHYADLEHSANGEYNGEARCRMAEMRMQTGYYDMAEKIIESIVADASSDYWLAYSFILWADVYYARGNRLQAKQTLQSIIENYDGDDLVNVARQKLAAINAEEQQQQAPEEEEIIIDIND